MTKEYEEFTPVESNTYPGFYVVRHHPNVLVSRDGKCISTDGVSYNVRRRNDGYGLVAGIKSTLDGERKERLLHVIQAWAFSPRLITEDNQIPNHLDGNPNNWDASNLEWTTYSGNILHAYQNGLRTDNRHVIVKNVKTQVEEEFYSLHEASRKLGVSVIKVFEHCQRPDWTLNGTYRLRYKGEKEIVAPVSLRDKHRHTPLIAKHVRSGEVIETETAEELATKIGVTGNTILTVAFKYHSKRGVNGWLIKSKYDENPFPELSEEEITRELLRVGNKTPISVFDETNQTETYHRSLADFASSIGVPHWLVRRHERKCGRYQNFVIRVI